MKLKYSISLFVFSLYVFCLLVPALRPGMYVDGVLYAAIAKNMAIGVGSIWDPYLSQTLFPHFFEHPSLALYLQSFFFKAFGQSYLVEHFYDLCVWAISLTVAVCLWVKTIRVNVFSVCYFLFIWILIPLNYTIVNNNLLECTANCATLLASLFLLMPTVLETNNIGRIIKLCLATFFMVVGFFVNGPTAFFPLSIPLLNTMITRRTPLRKGVFETVFLVSAVTFSIMSIFHWVPAAKHNMETYFNTQLFASITGRRDLAFTGWDHLHIVLLIIRNVWPASLVAGLLAYIGYRFNGVSDKRNQLSADIVRIAWLYFFIALAASLPVMVSHRQSFHYVALMSPFYALFLATLTYPFVKQGYDYLQSGGMSERAKKITSGISILLVIVSVGVMLGLAGTPREHGPMLMDVEKIVKVVPHQAVIGVSSAVRAVTDSNAYFARDAMISLGSSSHSQYYLTLQSQRAPNGFHQIHLPLQYFKLWEK